MVRVACLKEYDKIFYRDGNTDHALCILSLWPFLECYYRANRMPIHYLLLLTDVSRFRTNTFRSQKKHR